MGIGRPIDIYLAAGNGEREPLGRLVIGIAPIEYLVHGGRLASVICVKSVVFSICFKYRSERYRGVIAVCFWVQIILEHNYKKKNK